MRQIEWKYLVPSMALGAASFFVYVAFFDILMPGLPEGSYRLAVGQLFAIPSFILAFGQIAISAIFLYHIAAANGAKVAGTFSRSVFVASVLTFLFSLTYVIFPHFGPFYYIVFAAEKAPANVLPIEIAWTLAALLIGSLAYERIYKLGFRESLFYIALVYVFISVAAS
ncbi:MAG: hypothetical protein HYX24_03445 [Candidatus Aenigmarchaeota archaeon]|nr:hypothetical protein [Candidatus Aenigmarchaeota archaeon]